MKKRLIAEIFFKYPDIDKDTVYNFIKNSADFNSNTDILPKILFKKDIGNPAISPTQTIADLIIDVSFDTDILREKLITLVKKYESKLGKGTKIYIHNCKHDENSLTSCVQTIIWEV